MGFNFFRKRYTIRHFGEDEIIEGYAHTTYEDSEVMLNVQPLSGKELAALPEGERTTKRVKAYGDMIFTTGDQNMGRRGDWLLYHGHWYECVSSAEWDHTMLAHCKSEFVEIPASETMDDDVFTPDNEEGCECKWE